MHRRRPAPQGKHLIPSRATPLPYASASDEGRFQMAQIKKRTTAGGDDRWDVRTRIGGRVVTRSFRTKREATAHAATTESDKLRGVAIDPKRSRITLEDFGKRWLAGRHDLAATTADLYRHLFASHIVPDLGATELGSLTMTDSGVAQIAVASAPHDRG